MKSFVSSVFSTAPVVGNHEFHSEGELDNVGQQHVQHAEYCKYAYMLSQNGRR